MEETVGGLSSTGRDFLSSRWNMCELGEESSVWAGIMSFRTSTWAQCGQQGRGKKKLL